ncbi:acyl-CoA synthetase [Halovulum dunhuangense]|uniref:3-methylmercaptopropionyl-CoA ligase n=1 Tax=Halovulum dunhuangense TaxID=1505036 RepID=A0A849KQG5_9RHOB|nr:acyl-CoA synthetase [Halovulum dunhuangense]NNU79313.1 acyl-CoA synthetase [Halovulum dunhuangense]
MPRAHDALPRRAANHVALSPLSFLRRSAQVFPDRTAIVYGDLRRSWAETYQRCRRLASALRREGLQKGDVVAVMAVNTPELYECHFGVPMAGCVLNAVNTRLDAGTVAYILDHAEAKLLITDRAFSAVIREALSLCKAAPMVIDIDDPAAGGGELLGAQDYESFLAGGDPDFAWEGPADEWDAISINYTSGTTGRPKGVVYHHRGAYLNAVNNALEWSMPMHPTYLWTLPMFHCNGWCFPWTIAARAGTNVCVRQVSAASIYEGIAVHGADHLCGAPIVLSFMINATDEERREFSHRCKVMTAAAPPPAAVLQSMAEQGFEVTHVYGLTEVYGPAVACAWHEEWDRLPIAEQARLKARQGVAYLMEEAVIVADPDTLEEVPHDGETMGEILFRGNIVMKGYLADPDATDAALNGGWFHSGDLAVVQPDGYIQIRDRAKDIIISGGENISSIEVEDALFAHPAVQTAAVVAMPDPKWGETPCAFVELKPGREATAETLIAFVRDRLAHYKCPRHVVFGDVPRTSTGKIQKGPLRDRARAMAAGESQG